MIDKCTRENIFAKIGYRSTKSRKAIVSVLESAKTPLTVEEIFHTLEEMGESVNLSTVYRTLELLESAGLAQKAVMNDGRARYELNIGAHRHHLICTGCHKMVPLEGCPLEKLEKDVGKITDFNITGHRLELYGICPDCRKIQ